MPGLPVHHQLPELTQTHVHRVSDAIQPSYPLSSPSPPAFNLSQHQGLFKWVSSSHQVAQVLELQLQHQSFQWIFRTDVLSDGLVGSPCSPRVCQESSPTPQFESINSLVLRFLCGSTLTSIMTTTTFLLSIQKYIFLSKTQLLNFFFPWKQLQQLHYYWSTVDLQCCVCLGCTAKWFGYSYIYIVIYTHTYIHIIFQILFHYRLLQGIAYNCLCYTQAIVLAVYLFYIEWYVSVNLKLLIYPSPASPSVTVSLISLCVSLFLFYFTSSFVSFFLDSTYQWYHIFYISLSDLLHLVW